MYLLRKNRASPNLTISNTLYGHGDFLPYRKEALTSPHMSQNTSLIEEGKDLKQPNRRYDNLHDMWTLFDEDVSLTVLPFDLEWKSIIDIKKKIVLWSTSYWLSFTYL